MRNKSTKAPVLSSKKGRLASASARAPRDTDSDTVIHRTGSDFLRENDGRETVKHHSPSAGLSGVAKHFLDNSDRGTVIHRESGTESTSLASTSIASSRTSDGKRSMPTKAEKAAELQESISAIKSQIAGLRDELKASGRDKSERRSIAASLDSAKMELSSLTGKRSPTATKRTKPSAKGMGL
jgi:hypothetical protein